MSAVQLTTAKMLNRCDWSRRAKNEHITLELDGYTRNKKAARQSGLLEHHVQLLRQLRASLLCSFDGAQGVRPCQAHPRTSEALQEAA
jgi:hypothetical protein